MKKALAKNFLRFLSCLGISPLVILVRLHKYLFKNDNLFASFGQALALFPGKLGSYLRCGYYRFTLKRFSGDGFIGFGSFFPHASAEVGAGVYIGAYCIIGNASIGEGSLLASRVSVLSGGHQHSVEGRDPKGDKKESYYRKIDIGKGCWVGEGSVVMDNIGDFSVVGAGSVVTRELPQGVIAAGNPARVIKEVSTSKTEGLTLKEVKAVDRQIRFPQG